MIRAMIVEDSSDDAKLVELELARAGDKVFAVRVASAAEMQQALTSGEWNVIIAAYSVPGFGALPALELLKQSGCDIPFIVLSGIISDEMAVAAMRSWGA